MEYHGSVNKNISNIFWISSAIAILSVICAHCTYETFVLQRITTILGSIGVPIFLIRSGYFFNKDEPAKKFWTKKLKNIVIPWIIISPCLYAYSAVFSTYGFNLRDCFLYCIGYKTWLYFVPILMAYYAVFRLFKGNWFLGVSIALFVVSNILDVYGINPVSNISTPYLNIFNRIGYFAVGILLGSRNWLEPLIYNKKLSCICCLLVLPLGIPFIRWYSGVAPTVLLMLYRFCLVYCVFVIASHCLQSKILIAVGKDTYLAFFLHMQFGLGAAALLLRTLHIANEYIIFFIKPILTLILVVVGIFVLRKIIYFIKLDKYAWIIGLRTDARSTGNERNQAKVETY